MRGRGWLHYLYRGTALFLTSLYLVQEVIYAVIGRDDVERLAKVMFLLLCHVTSLAKQITFAVDADRIDQMLSTLQEPLFVPSNPRHVKRLAEAARGVRLVLQMYAGAAAATCTLWSTLCLLQRVRGIPVEFPLSTGLPSDSVPFFAVALIYTYTLTTLVGIGNTTMDALLGTVLGQSRTQISIIRDNLESILEDADKECVETKEPRDEVLMRRFLRCLRHYDKVVQMTILLQDIFGTAILVQFGIGGWILCMAAYKIVGLNVISMEFASMIMFTSCILIELFLYCYYGNEVSVESTRIMDSLYAVRWTETRREFRRALVLAMERCKRPLRPAVAGLMPLSLETFVKILKSSYTCYAVLRQTK